MNSKSKPTRLSKAAREFNVSTGTIVSFLKKKGYEIATNPNAKVSPEMYELLLKEYSQEKSVKEEAKKHNLKYTQKKSISLEDKEEEESESELEEEEEEGDDFEDAVFIKNTSLSSTQPKPENKQEEPEQEKASEAKEEKAKEETPETGKEQPEAKQEAQKEKGEKQSEKKEEAEESEESAQESTESKVKVLGKIDLDSIEPSRSKSRKADSDKKSAEKKKESKEKPAVKKETAPKQEKKAPEEQKKQEAPKEEVKKEQPEKTEPISAEAKEERKEKPKTAPRKADKKAVKKEGPKQEKAKEDKAEEKAQKEQEKSVEKEKPAPKEESKQPQEDQKEQKSEEKEESKQKDEDNFIKTKVQKLDGPKILGTIDLPDPKKVEKKKQDRKKEERKKRHDSKKPAAKKPEKEAESDQGKRKPVASSKDESIKPKKKRRKRIKPELSQKGESGKGAFQDNKSTQKQRGKPGKKTVSKKGKKPLRHEPSEEEVQKQLKETMARLSGSGKSKASKHRRTKRDAIKQKEQEQTEEEKRTIKVTEFVTVNELANMMEADVNQVISTCMSLGLFVSINQRLDAETISLVADEFGYNVEFVSVEVQEALEEQEAEEKEVNEEDLEPRAPIITVMGHVDHGKTSLLDYIRQENVIGGEAGGITQHIGAYEVETQSGKKITFLDTPGHEAFTAMRARGAQVTDIAIIIIAADDQIMPQTVEAMNHAQAAGVPIVFAINKVDKPGANPEKIKEQLSHRNILVEDWGGKYQNQEISAKKGDGVEELLEKVLLEAEILDLKGNPNKKAKGAVIESSLDKGRGYVANLLVQDGTLKKSDYVLAGAHSGKVRAMYNELNQQIEEAGPSTPVLMLGLDGAPQAGDQFNVFDDEREAKELANKRRQLQREQGIRTQKHVTLDEIGRRIAIGDFKELNIIVKGDVDGSVEALADALLKLGTEEVQVNVIHKSVGQISESDVMLASASEAIIVGFQVRPSAGAKRIAEKEQIDIRTYSVIYKAIEEVKSAIEGMLAPKIEEKVVANLEVRNVFKITKVGTVAGCKVLDGVITRNTRVRVIRDGIVIHTGQLGSLKRYKDDVKEVKAGYECGLNLQNFNDIKEGDIIEGFKEVEIERKLDDKR